MSPALCWQCPRAGPGRLACSCSPLISGWPFWLPLSATSSLCPFWGGCEFLGWLLGDAPSRSSAHGRGWGSTGRSSSASAGLLAPFWPGATSYLRFRVALATRTLLLPAFLLLLLGRVLGCSAPLPAPSPWPVLPDEGPALDREVRMGCREDDCGAAWEVWELGVRLSCSVPGAAPCPKASSGWLLL